MDKAFEIRALRLERYYRQNELWEKSRGWHRLLWVEDGRGIVYIQAGLDFHIPQYAQGGWIVFFSEFYLQNFLRNHKSYLCSPLFDTATLQAFIKIDQQLLSEFALLVNQLIKSIDINRDPEYLQPYLNLLLLHAADRYAAEHSVQLKSWTAEIWRALRELMNQHYKSRLATGYYAAQLKMDERKLNEICKQFSGKNILGKLNDMRFAESQRLLLLTTDPVKVIGLELGYESPSQFSNFFKKLKGMSPSDYRKFSRTKPINQI